MVSAGHKHRPLGHKATKTDIIQQTSSFSFQETLKDLKKEVAVTEQGWIYVGRGPWQS
jgi:hypothetical protein